MLFSVVLPIWQDYYLVVRVREYHLFLESGSEAVEAADLCVRRCEGVVVDIDVGLALTLATQAPLLVGLVLECGQALQHFVTLHVLVNGSCIVYLPGHDEVVFDSFLLDVLRVDLDVVRMVALLQAFWSGRVESVIHDGLAEDACSWVHRHCYRLHFERVRLLVIDLLKGLPFLLNFLLLCAFAISANLVMMRVVTLSVSWQLCTKILRFLVHDQIGILPLEVEFQ